MTRPPSWIEDTADRAAALFQSEDILAPIGCHFFHDEEQDLWEVSLFVSLTETLGGPCDGKLTRGRFSIDVRELMSLFSEIARFDWQAVSFGDDDDLGPHLAIEGLVGGASVWLRILSEPPREFEPGRIADVHRAEFRDRW